MALNIGIVTISFNQAKYVEDCVRSILPQLASTDCYVIVDPGSADGSREIISNLCERDSRVTLIYEPDRGASHGLNKGFESTAADIIGYINSDDFLLEGTIEYVRNFFEQNPEIDVLIGAVKLADFRGKLARRGRIAELPDLTKFLTAGFLYVQQGTFIRKEAFKKTKGFNEENKTCWDYELIIDLALMNFKFHIVHVPLAAFRIHGESITGKGENHLAHLLTMNRIIRKVQDAGFSSRCFLMKLYYIFDRKTNPIKLLKQYSIQ